MIMQRIDTYAEMAARILDAVSETHRHRTHGQICRFLRKSADEVIPVINGLIAEGHLRMEENASCTAFFLAKAKPERFWLSGTGTVEAVFQDGDPRARLRRNLKSVSQDEIRDAAEKFPNQAEIARHLNISVATLHNKLTDPDLRRAYNEGVDRRPKKEPARTRKQRRAALNAEAALVGRMEIPKMCFHCWANVTLGIRVRPFGTEYEWIFCDEQCHARFVSSPKAIAYEIRRSGAGLPASIAKEMDK